MHRISADDTIIKNKDVMLCLHIKHAREHTFLSNPIRFCNHSIFGFKFSSTL